MTHPDPDAVLPPSDGRVEQVLRSMTEADAVRHEPPAGLLAAIHAELDDASDSPEVPAAPDSTGPTVVSLDERRNGFRTRFLAAAASVAIIGGVGGYFALRDDAPTPPATRTLASAQLEPLEDLGSTTASARLVDEGGQTHLVIEATDMAPAPAGSEYELWLIDPDVSDPRSLGVVTGSGDIEVPRDIDPDRYPIVDISLEPVDGNHQHSGHSLMRGTLQ